MNEPIVVVFPNAPITEAVLDIRVEPHPSLDLTKLGAIHDRVVSRFPDQQGITDFEAGIVVAPEGGQTITQTSARPLGFLLRSGDQTKVTQITRTGFTFNKLKPYEDWARFQSEARELWQYYVELAEPVKVTRVALRYINRIELPLPFADFKEFILTAPEIAPGISQGLDHFFMRLEIPYPNELAAAIVTLTIDRSTPIIETVPIIFDIDVFRVSPFLPLSSLIWESLESLRLLKNRIFFSSLTERAKELFQ